MAVLKVATCQFPVSSSIQRNSAAIQKQLREAAGRKADVVHFSECALSGYTGFEIRQWKGFPWETLHEETRKIQCLAGKLKVWTVLGSVHRLSNQRRPHNSLYIINPRGDIVDRYDKRFCTPLDQTHFTPGDHFVTFTIRGIKCSALICYDVRFPELYRALKKLEVQCIFQSFYNARAAGRGIHSVIMTASVQARAATNFFWISANNSSAYYQSWPSIFVTPDGDIVQSLKRHRAGVMINTVDTKKKYYDASRRFRNLAMRGRLSNGGKVSDPRSGDRKSL